jgi:ABC-type multidrug transport system fused ATPase/permease subunit
MTTRFHAFWQRKKTEERSWRWLLLHFHFGEWCLTAVLDVMADLASWMVPITIRQLLSMLQDREAGVLSEQPLTIYGLAIVYLLVVVFRIVVENCATAKMNGLSYQMRSALAGALYDKALRFSNASRQKYEGGTALNVVNVDPMRIASMIQLINTFWIVPLRLIMAFALCIYYLRASAVPGLVVILASIPILLWMAMRVKRYRVRLSRVSDRRMQATQEALHGIKVLKYLGWEDVAARKIARLREKELKLLKRSNILYGNGLALTFWTPIFAATVAIAVSIWRGGGKVNAESVFAAIMAFQALISPLRQLPTLVNTYVSARTAMDRVTDFLNAPEANIVSKDCQEGLSVQLDNATLEWEAPPPDVKSKRWAKKNKKRRKTLELPLDSTLASAIEPFKLYDISLHIPKGALVAVVGPIGAGKTSLLESFLGDLRLESGHLAVSADSLGYCAQHAFIRNATVRDNILFGKPFNAGLYAQVVKECCLERDLELLPFGDETLIGDRGATISGGQRQRIGLARVFYAKPQLALLDDPLSAVDANVGRQLFESLRNGMLQESTRIMATHNRAILDAVDLIVVLDRGRVKAAGSYSELISSSDPKLAALRQILISSCHNHFGDDGGDSEEMEESEDDEIDHDSVNSADDESKVDKDAAGFEEPDSDDDDDDDDNDDGRVLSPPVITLDKPIIKRTKQGRSEEKIARHASAESVQAYIRGCGGMRALTWILILVFATEIVRVSKDLFMKEQISDTPALSVMAFVALYTGLGIAQGLFCAASNYMAVLCCTRASRFIHDACIAKVLAARLAVFETTPVGRILSRFSRDQDSIDNTFPDKLTFLVTSLSIIVAALMVVVFTAPMVALTFVLPVLGAYGVQKAFGLVWRQMQQLNGQALGPVIAHFGETLHGLTTMRAQGATFTSAYTAVVDEYMATRWWLVGIRRWLGLRSELVANLYVFGLMLLCVYLRLPYPVVGLLMTYMVNAADSIDWSMKNLAEVESCFVSVERLYKYAVDLPSEEDRIVMLPPTEKWPNAGWVIFNNVTVRYRPELPPALEDVTFSVQPGEKVAIVGRTGAGKSSIITCLFRFVELDHGSISIDGVDVRKMPVRVLRRALAMVPQDPVLFGGTLRFNLDPEEKNSDAELFEALESTFLLELVSSHPLKLEMDVSGLSMGQRQLLCLARSVLRRSKLVILDEATSSIDRDTDAMIQQSMRRCFSDATVLCVAHRLETIMHYDRVIVMAAGRILEMGPPTKLACMEGSVFSGMCSAAGVDVNPIQ